MPHKAVAAIMVVIESAICADTSNATLGIISASDQSMAMRLDSDIVATILAATATASSRKTAPAAA